MGKRCWCNHHVELIESDTDQVSYSLRLIKIDHNIFSQKLIKLVLELLILVDIFKNILIAIQWVINNIIIMYLNTDNIVQLT